MGSNGCTCINATDTLASLSERRCELPNGEIGIRLTISDHQCVPFSYGSSQCLQHDLIYDPSCDVDKAAERIIDAYCLKPFCYVDVHRCRKESQERVYRSSYFPRDSGVDLYYSYTTCNSTADDWLEAEKGMDYAGDHPFGGVSIDAAIPMYVYPMMYKRDSNEEVLITSGEEFYDDNIPYEGVYINYANNIQKLSRGDIQNMTLTHKSRVSGIVHPQSSFTASIQDIEDGFIDMAIGPFWITGERLAMSAFTIPIVPDKTYLVIPRPGTQDKFSDQIKKVLAPFTPGLWILLVGIIFCTALFSVWFTDRSAEAMNQNQNDRRMSLQGNIAKKRRRKRAYARLVLDSCLQKGLFFCSAGVEQDENASLPSKLLLFGFGFFILISVSAYVANLAAFLTLSTTDFINTMEGAVAAGVTICAHPAVKVELEIAWPDAKFYFDQGDFHAMLEYVDQGICPFMAVGHEDTVMDSVYLAKLCERDLVYSDSVVAEIPLAFPIRADLASGFSYWMHKGERSGVTLQTSKDEYTQEKTCDVHFSKVDTESSEYDKIGVKNMMFPVLFFGTCTVLAVIMQIEYICQSRRGRESLVGTWSTLNLVTDVPETNGTTSWAKRRVSTKEEEDEEK
mmetsp:Transcript_41160/g.86336  ORF Transcript_41160/g.86336 Transcript_41160/m.86336 type:complete len:622 (-) Transcript_41160:278-2143(-)